MVVDLGLENRRHSEALAERKLEIEEIKDDFRTFRRGLCAKMKRLYKTMGHEELYDAAP